MRWSGALVGALLVLGWLAPGADAAVLCERKGKIKIRSAACKPKETLVQDLGQQATRLETLVQDLGQQATRLTHVTDLFEISCPAQPSRQFASGPPSFLFGGDECAGACRAFDGDPHACEGSFQVGWEGPTACVHLDGRCVPCLGCGENAGRCLDACQPRPCADPSRTRFLGLLACRDLTTEGDCTTAWSLDHARRPSACYWDAGALECSTCTDGQEGDLKCSNPCRAAGECADATRTLVSFCSKHNDDQTACNESFHYNGGPRQGPYSCYYDAAKNACFSCTTVAQLRGRCTDTCNVN